MKEKILSLPGLTVVGLRIRVKSMSPEIPALWGRFVPRIAEIRNPGEPEVAYGVMGNFDETTHMIDYMAGIPVTAAAEVPVGMTAWNVPPATYAVFGTTLTTIGETFSKIFGEWLPNSAYVQAAGPSLERYDETFKPDAGATAFSILIPVAPKG